MLIISCREYLDLSKKKNTEFFFFEKKMTSLRFKTIYLTLNSNEFVYAKIR